MSELEKLIHRLKGAISKKSSLISTIRYPNLLINALTDLKNVIGNHSVKDAIATQIQHLIISKRRAKQNKGFKEDNVMSNIVLYGPPGVGKTMIGMKLAKILYYLGYLDTAKANKEQTVEIRELLRDAFDGGGSDSITTAYVIAFIILVIITIASLAWTMYSRFGLLWMVIIISAIVLFVIILAFWLTAPQHKDIGDRERKIDADEEEKEKGKGNEKVATDSVTDDDIIKVVTRDDFVGQYVGWSAPKTKKLLSQNLGKVLFIDEAYSLINGLHDEFGMEALTALNLFLSQHPNEIIVIFAGYKDLLETGIFAAQPGLCRRAMWQFDCPGYTGEELFQIFKLQLKKKGWGLADEEATKQIIIDNMDAFPSYGGDTERAGYFAELEHSRDFLDNDSKFKINVLVPDHVAKGIEKLRANNIQTNTRNSHTSNPMANMMRMFKNGEEKKGDEESETRRLNDFIKQMTGAYAAR